MKVRVIQPAYTFNAEDLQKNYEGMVALMEECNEPLDIIVMPEYCDIPAAQSGKAAYRAAIAKYGEKIAVGADVKDGYIAIKGWVEKSNVTLDEFFAKMQAIGVCTVICTDISKDGAMRGTNLSMYAALSHKYSVNIVASGGVSTLDDVKALTDMQIYGAIIGKAYYTGAIDLAEALEVAGDN